MIVPILLALALTSQASLPDDSALVATTDGLYFVLPPAQPAVRLAEPGDFGRAVLDEPAIQWLDGSDRFLMSAADSAGRGGLWRIERRGAGVRIEDLSPSIVLGPRPDLVDCDYAVGADAAFLLDRANRRILRLPAPGTASGSEFEVWSTLVPAAASHLAVNAAEHPFGILVTAPGSWSRVSAAGATPICTTTNWTLADANPVAGFTYVGQPGGLVGKTTATCGLVVNMNTYLGCQYPAQRPVDFEWDQRFLGGVILAEDGIASNPFCPWSFPGSNQIVRFPPGQGVIAPELLTYPLGSGISGVDGDLALVRRFQSDVSFEGLPAVAGGGEQPTLGRVFALAAPRLGATLELTLSDAPRGAASWLVIGRRRSGGLLQGQVLVPYPDLLIPVAVDARGSARRALTLPTDPAALGERFWAQWWVDDVTTAPPGDLVSSQGAGFRIGLR